MTLMHIVHIASELAPLAKVGGLADVLLGLSRELSWKGHDVDIIIPKYDCLNINDVSDLHIDFHDLMSFYEGEWHRNTVWMGYVENLRVYFIDPHHPRYFFQRGCFYGCEDDIERYLYFSRCAIEFIYKRGMEPDIIHLHDWQAASIAPIYKEIYQPLGFKKPHLVFTIHNIEYQGKCAPADLDKIGLNGSALLTDDTLQDNLHPALVNLLKGAIVFSDAVTTVSPNYAKEVLHPEGGRGLEKTLLLYQHKFSGILNGIDYSYWNPEVDRFIPVHFSSRTTPVDPTDHRTLDRKGYLKSILRERLMLGESHSPIVGCVARLVPQKGVELIKDALYRTLEKGGQFVLLGSSPIPSIDRDFHLLKKHYDTHPNVHFSLFHQEELAHMIYAAADMIIVPSLFEPCGLTQMIALKYGAIPIVRKTGGLADTIFDVDYSEKPLSDRNGYVFEHPDRAGIYSALDRALNCWFSSPDKWRSLVIKGMNIDFSWNHPSNKYLELYQKLGHKETLVN